MCSCSLTAENISLLTMQYLKETLLRELSRSCRTWDFCQCPQKDWGPFSWSNPNKHFAVCYWLLSASQRLFHNIIATMSSQHADTWGLFLFLFRSHLREMYSETLIGHSPHPVSNASLCELSSQGSGSLGQCLFLHQADGKYLVSLIYLKPAKQGL